MLTLALPKGRIFDAVLPHLEQAKLAPATAVDDSLRIMVDSVDPQVRLIIVRSADVATYVCYGAAQAGLVGRDLLLEKPLDGVLHQQDLGIAPCKLAVAARKDFDYAAAIATQQKLKVATKYPVLAQNYFARAGISAEVVRLYGSMELAPNVGLADVIVDIVATGKTLAANNLVQVAEIMDISTYLVVNQAASWRQQEQLADIATRLTAGQ